MSGRHDGPALNQEYPCGTSGKAHRLSGRLPPTRHSQIRWAGREPAPIRLVRCICSALGDLDRGAVKGQPYAQIHTSVGNMRAIITGLTEELDEDQQQVLGWSLTLAMNAMGINVNGVRVEFHSDEECP